VDGTRLTAEGRSGALAVIAVADRGTMYAPGSLVYMDKIAVGEEAAGAVDINAPVRHNLEQVGKAVGKEINEITAIILDRPRNAEYIRQVREAGARISLIGDGDIQAAIATCIHGNGIDIMLGIGGSPEAVTTACAMSALRGEIQCKLWPRDDAERAYAHEHGLDLTQVLTTTDLVSTDNTFFAATGVTTGPLLKGVHFGRERTETHSVVMRGQSGTVRFIEAYHRVEWVEGDIKP
jgi:fructose-1,6-bisphosphatase II